MAGYAMVEALRAMNVEKVALNAAYHWPAWWQGTVGFLKGAGFDVMWAGISTTKVGSTLRTRLMSVDGYSKGILQRKALNVLPIGHDTALYWQIFKSLGIKPNGQHGRPLQGL